MQNQSFVRVWQIKTDRYPNTTKCYPRARKILAGKNSARTLSNPDSPQQKFQSILFHLSTILADAEDSDTIILLIRPTALFGALIKS